MDAFVAMRADRRRLLCEEAGATLRPGGLRLVPAEDRRSAWARDYDAMREAMFFGEPPTFDEILAVVRDFERRFNEVRT